MLRPVLDGAKPRAANHLTQIRGSWSLIPSAGMSTYLVTIAILLIGAGLVYQAARSREEEDEEEEEERRAWPRFLYRHGGGDALVSWYVPGTFRDFAIVLPPRYRSRGVPDGLAIRQIDSPAFYAANLFIARKLGDRPLLKEAFDRATTVLEISGNVHDPVTLDYLRDLVGFVAYALDAGGVGVIDGITQTVWSPEDWRQKVFAPGHLVPEAHVVARIDEDRANPGRMWFRTRGMRLFGRPDLGIRNISRERIEEVAAAARLVVQRQMLGARITDREPFSTAGVQPGTAWFHVGAPGDPDFLNTHLEAMPNPPGDGGGMLWYRSGFDQLAAQAPRADGSDTLARSEAWMRPQYKPGGGDAEVNFVIYGAFVSGSHEVPASYQSNGLSMGLKARLEANDQSWKQWATQVAAFERGGYAAEVHAAPHRLRIAGTVHDPDSLEYLRDLIGIITYHIDNGGVCVVDEESGLTWSASDWKRQARGAGRLRITELMQLLHTPDGAPAKVVVQTKGMRLFGRPDLRIRGVPLSREVDVMGWLLAVAEKLARGGVIVEGEPASADDLFRDVSWRTFNPVEGQPARLYEITWPQPQQAIAS